jgi:hypothetical protein
MAEQAGTPKGGRTGGPKTVAGKSASARNATKHGLFALTPMPGPEQDALSAKVAQLTAYYRPDSPLAQLQIQRIARCAAKLESLYTLEQTKIDLALLQSQTAPDQCMAHFAHYPAEARNLAKAWLSNTATKLPCKLTSASLQEVCTEIGAYFGSLENLEDLRRVFPKLRKVLEKANTGADGVPMPMDDLLWAASKIIKSYIDLQLRDPVDAADPGGQTVDRFLTSMLAKVADAEGHRHGARPVVDPPAYQNQVFEGLNIFKTLNGFCQQAAEIVAAFPKIQSMLSASTMMPPDDSDRLMRYQTALEKQLSRYMGEFLQLQKLGPVPT